MNKLTKLSNQVNRAILSNVDVLDEPAIMAKLIELAKMVDRAKMTNPTNMVKTARRTNLDTTITLGDMLDMPELFDVVKEPEWPGPFDLDDLA